MSRKLPQSPPPVDVISGGFPCQPVSVNGNRKGQKDNRWLWPEMLAIIRMVKPTFVIIENVPGILSMGIGDIYADLESQAYHWQTYSIPACSIEAVHKRERIWIIAYPNALRQRCQEFDFATFAERQSEGARGNHPFVSLKFGDGTRNPDQSEILRMADGLSLGLDAHSRNARIHALGNAIMPQLAYIIFLYILQLQEYANQTGK